MCEGHGRNVLSSGTASAPQAGCSAKLTSAISHLRLNFGRTATSCRRESNLSTCMESNGWSWRNLRAEVESQEAADAFFYTGAPVEAYQDCFYASAGTMMCRCGQKLAIFALSVSSCINEVCTVRHVAINEVLLQLCVWGPLHRSSQRRGQRSPSASCYVANFQKLSICVPRDDGLSACRGRRLVWVDCGDMHGVRCGAVSQPERRGQTDLDIPHSILPDIFGDGSPLQHSNGSRTVCARSSKWSAATIYTALHILPFGLSASHVCL